MTNISQIKVDSDWGQEAARINQNFQNMNTDLEKVKSATTKFRGYFTSEAGLKSKYPSPKVGDTAWVGEPYPGKVYDVVTDGTWHNTEKAPDTDSVDLTDYAKKAELVELEGKTSLLQDDTDKNTSEISETKAKVEENSSSIASLKLEKQDTLNFDAIPTLGSNNPVTSGGIRTALDEQKSEVDAAKEEAIQTINETEQSAITNFNAQRVTPEMLSESTKQLINTAGGGTINNLPDDEDLTSQDDGTGSYVMKLADRSYNPTNFSGKGYKIIRKNIVDGKNVLTQDMINEANTVYEIRYDFDLNEAEITIPENCTLYFIGGSLYNGSIKYTNTYILGNAFMDTDILSNSTIANPEIIIDWFGAIPNDKSVDNGKIFDKLSKISNITTIIVPGGTYYCNSFIIPAFATIKGNRVNSIIKANSDGKTYSYSDWTINNIFIAVQSPYCTLQDINIDGGEQEGYSNICLGLYQVAYLFRCIGCRFLNGKLGAIHQYIRGGFNLYKECEFLTGGDEFTVRLSGEVDTTMFERCNFERINKSTSTIIWIDETITIVKAFCFKNNRFEEIVASYIFKIKNAGYQMYIGKNMYLCPNLKNNAVIYYLDNQATNTIVEDEDFQSIGSVAHPFIINPNNIFSLEINNPVFSLNDNCIGYLDENGEFHTLFSGTEFAPCILIKSINRYSLHPNATKDSKFALPQNVTIGLMNIYYEGTKAIIDTGSPVQYPTLKGNRLFAQKKDGTEFELTWLLQNIFGTSSNRPTSPSVGSFYYDNTIKKPIWWNGSNWVDATGEIM